MTIYQKALAELAPELNPLHMETLAYSIGSTLNGMPPEFFDEVAEMAREMGPERLAEWHNAEIVPEARQTGDRQMTKFNVYANGTFWGQFEAETAEQAIQDAADEHGTIDVGETHASTEGMTAEEAAE